MKWFRVLRFEIPAICLLVLCGSGCGSIVSRTGSQRGFLGNGVYPGVRATPQTLHDCRADSESDLAVLFILDFPFTFVFDTVLLPADLIHGASSSSVDDQPPNKALHATAAAPGS